MIDLRFIGCNGGIGVGSGEAMRHTTCYGLGSSLIIDAGTGLCTLTLEELACIDHVLLTHAHFDHLAGLPLMIDSVATLRSSAVTVWALPDVIEILREHLFNDRLWPDFSRIPAPDAPFLRFAAISDGAVEIAGHRVTPLPARHGVPACGYRIERGGTAVYFSGDSGDCPDFWSQADADPALAAVIVECSYPSHMSALAELSQHLHAGQVAERLACLRDQVSAVVVHRKPGLDEDIAAELLAGLPGLDLRLPSPGDRYRF